MILYHPIKNRLFIKIGNCSPYRTKIKWWYNVKIGCGIFPLYEPAYPHDFIKLILRDVHAFSRECIQHYQNGVSLNEIARIVGRSKARVRRVLHQHGFQTGIKIAEKVYAAWRKTGRTRAQPLFGFTYYMGQLVEEPREQQILILIERLALEGKCATEIANHLNARGMKPRRAKAWHRNSIVKILLR